MYNIYLHYINFVFVLCQIKQSRHYFILMMNVIILLRSLTYIIINLKFGYTNVKKM